MNGVPCKYTFKVLWCIPQLNNSQSQCSSITAFMEWRLQGGLEWCCQREQQISLGFTPISAASGCEFMLEMSKCRRRKTHCLVQGSRCSCCQALHHGSFVSFHWNVPFFQVPGDNEKHWKPVLVVLTEKDLLIYESMPRMKEAWFSPLHTYPLLATRYLFFLITATKVLGMVQRLYVHL